MPTGDHTGKRASPPGFQHGVPIASSRSVQFTATQGSPASLPKSLSQARLREATKKDVILTFEVPIVH